MRLQIDGVGPVRLTDRDFVASGGEGKVYAKNGVAFKLFDRPEDAPKLPHLRALQAITDPWVVVPRRRLFNDSGLLVGHTMAHITGTWPLIRLVSPGFRAKHHISGAALFPVLAQMAQTLSQVHAAGVTVVDLNPMNLLVRKDLSGTHWIDTAGWQTPHRATTAILPSIKDPFATRFDARSDGYAFAVVAFWLLVGLHPFKGNHPVTKGLSERMKAKIWAYHPEVCRPPTAPAQSALGPWRDWLHNVLSGDLRTPPPTLSVSPTPVKSLAVLRTPSGHSVTVRFDATGRLQLLRDDGRAIPCHLRADDWVAWQGRMVIRTEDQLLELRFTDLGNTTVAMPTALGGCLPHATQLFPGLAIQDLLGKPWLIRFHPEGQSTRTALPDLGPGRIVSARIDDKLHLTVARGTHRAAHSLPLR